MEFSDIERILALVREHDLAEFELERDGLKLRVRKAGAVPSFHAPPIAPVAAVPPRALPAAAPVSAPQAVPVPMPPAGDTPADDTPVELAVVKSPIVGTFYRSPEPGARAVGV